MTGAEVNQGQGWERKTGRAKNRDKCGRGAETTREEAQRNRKRKKAKFQYKGCRSMYRNYHSKDDRLIFIIGSPILVGFKSKRQDVNEKVTWMA